MSNGPFYVKVCDVLATRHRADVRLHRLAEHLHALGPAPTLHALIDIAGGADLRMTLERYGDLPPEFIHQLGGDHFPRPLHIVSQEETA